MTVTAENIAKIPLFGGLERRELEAIATVFHEDAFPAGKVIVRDSDRNPSFYILTKGKAEVRRRSEVVATLTPYQFFGEILTLGYQRERTADVVAVEPCACLVSGPGDMQRLLSSNISVGRRMLREMRERYKNDHPPDI